MAMDDAPVILGPSDEERYGWPGVDPGVLDGACVPVARHLVRAQVGRVGFLPAAGALPPGAELGPLLAHIATAVLGFATHDVALIDTWRTWVWGQAMEAGDSSLYRKRALRPRVFELAPVPCGDPLAATTALQATLARFPEGVGLVLVNLDGYGEPGTMPPALDAVEGVVLLARARRSRRAAVERMGRFLPAAKNLGAILLD
jgi:hypothetical protein